MADYAESDDVDFGSEAGYAESDDVAFGAEAEPLRTTEAVASADANQLFNAKRTEIMTHMFGDNAV
jgi:hypothetical protein